MRSKSFTVQAILGAVILFVGCAGSSSNDSGQKKDSSSLFSGQNFLTMGAGGSDGLDNGAYTPPTCTNGVCGGNLGGPRFLPGATNLAAARFDPVNPADCEMRSSSVYLNDGSGASGLNIPVVSIAAGGASANSAKGVFILNRAIDIPANYKLQRQGDLGPSNLLDSWTVLSCQKGAPIASQTKCSVVERTYDYSGTGGAVNVNRDQPVLVENCDTAGFNPLNIYGTGFPQADSGIYLAIELSDASSTCKLFKLDGSRYRYINQTNGQWNVPPYQDPWAYYGDPSDDVHQWNENGQVNPFFGGCTGNITGKSAKITIASDIRPQSAWADKAFVYGVQPPSPAAPRIDQVCATSASQWSIGKTDKGCILKGTSGNGADGSLKVATGDYLTITGQNFQRKNETAVNCTDPGSCNVSGRQKYSIAADVYIGGIKVIDDINYKFALTDSTSSNTDVSTRNGGCNSFTGSSSDNSGGVCQRITVRVPQIPVQRIPAFVSVAVQNADSRRDEHGGQASLHLGDPGDRKVRYYGGSITVTATPTPVPVIITSVASNGTHSLKVSFTEVADDPAGYPKAGMPVDHYDLRESTSAISSASFASAYMYPNALPGGLPGSTRDVIVDSISGSPLAANTSYCFSAKAIDANVDAYGNTTYGLSSFGNSLCGSTDPLPINNPPCPIVLQGEPLSDTSLRLHWLEPSGEGCGTTITVAAEELRYRSGATDFTDAEFSSMSQLPVGYIGAPGATHTMTMSNLAPSTTYMFGIRSQDPVAQGSDWSVISNHLPITTMAAPTPTATPVGTGEFVNLSVNLPNVTNAGNSIDILPSIDPAGHPWVLMADQSNGIRVFKVADSYNVSAVPENTMDGVPHYVDELPSSPTWRGDGMPDLIERDRHSLRFGAGKDCDGVDVGTLPNDSYALCNFPQITRYNKASQIAVGRINADSFKDVLIANPGALSGDRDGLYINSGQDLCNQPGRTDVVDGIPCFLNPVDLPPQNLNGQRDLSTRIKLYDKSDDGVDDPADLIAVTTDVRSLSGLTFYSNGCKSRSGNCSPNDFTVVTREVIDSNVALPLYCEDVVFTDLNRDGMRDLVCVRTNNMTTANQNGVNLTFVASMGANGLPYFTRIQGILPSSAYNDCNHSFGAVNKLNLGAAAKDYLLIGYSMIGDPAGRGSNCGTELYSAEVGRLFSEKTLPGLGSTISCHSGLITDSRSTQRPDIALACGLPSDMESDGAFRGPKLFLNDGNDAFANFEPGPHGPQSIFAPSASTLGQPICSAPNYASPLIYSGDPFADPYVPGAVNVVGAGDLDLDGVPDLYFGNGSISTGSSNLDWVFKQMKQ